MASIQTHRRKLEAVKIAEGHGVVADNMDMRHALIERMNAGELTLEQVQSELKRVKRTAKKNGKLTREQVYRKG